ncbi:MAG: ABC transporter permease [Marmoricola sp.]
MSASFGRQIRSLVRRNLIHIKRQPEALTDVTIQPVMFVLLFAYVFGGSINIPGGSYREWLLPGIMAQTMAFSSFVVAIGLNNDLQKGIIDRFRSLPIHRPSVLLARAISLSDALQHRHCGDVTDRTHRRVADPRRGRQSDLGLSACCSSASP